jgi:serine/threonine-protein kinase ATR
MNVNMSENRKQIPRHVFYSALPQLISRIAHPERETQRITVDILKKVLVAHPRQAMWGLAWLKHSHSKTRKDHGDDIFRLAADELKKTDKESHNLLKESTELFKLLKGIADNDKVAQGRRFEMPRPRFKNSITLQDFVPPVQAALSMNVAQRMNKAEREKRQKGVIAEVFPQYVPRIESFSSHGKVFNTKAKPKQITAYAVGMRREGQGRERRIGEIHFLVKKENKGDLRKDARVQDLNNVLNRLLVSGGKKGENGGRGGQRRLQLRTYSVTCLSEDTGIMEWVPNTNSLRNVIGTCVNSQVEADNPKRRGGRVTEFGRKSLRDTFAHCQNFYVADGKLLKAAAEFER